MKAAPVGAVVRIYYDGKPVEVGEALRTPTGRTYVVIDKRVQQRGEHVGRQHLACRIEAEPPPGVRVLPLLWYPRKRKRPALRELLSAWAGARW